MSDKPSSSQAICDANFLGPRPKDRTVFARSAVFLWPHATASLKEPHGEHERLASVTGGNKERTATMAAHEGRT